MHLLEKKKCKINYIVTVLITDVAIWDFVKDQNSSYWHELSVTFIPSPWNYWQRKLFSTIYPQGHREQRSYQTNNKNADQENIIMNNIR